MYRDETFWRKIHLRAKMKLLNANFVMLKLQMKNACLQYTRE